MKRRFNDFVLILSPALFCCKDIEPIKLKDPRTVFLGASVETAQSNCQIIDAGQCKYYKEDQTFPIGGFTPKGMCVSAYMAVIHDSQAMRYGATLPWQKDG